jgi:hypothetical protein
VHVWLHVHVHVHVCEVVFVYWLGWTMGPRLAALGMGISHWQPEHPPPPSTSPTNLSRCVALTTRNPGV